MQQATERLYEEEEEGEGEHEEVQAEEEDPVTSVSICTALDDCLLGFLSGFFCFFFASGGFLCLSASCAPQM